MAFKNEIESPPEKTAADEEFLKTILLQKRYEAAYQRSAKVYNNGPDYICQLFNQRQRVHIGHLDLKRKTDYTPPSLDTASPSTRL